MGVPNKQDIVCQESTVSQPEVNLNIYETIDYLGQHCQDTLQIEKKIQTKSQNKRVSMSLFEMCYVNVWLMYTGCTKENIHRRNCHTNRSFDSHQNLGSMSSVLVSRATQKHKKGSVGKFTKFYAQDCCLLCFKAKPTSIQSSCEDELCKTLHFCE